MANDQGKTCIFCGRETIVYGYTYGACDDCTKAALRAYKRNRDSRAKNAILREVCGTSARAAREDMGL